MSGKGTMAQTSEFLSSSQPRARWMRLDTAQLLKRFFFCERSLLVSEAAWIPAIAPLDVKIGMARAIWQSAETAHALRNRVFELRFPSRMLEEQGADHALIELFGAVKDSPSVPAFLVERWKGSTARVSRFLPRISRSVGCNRRRTYPPFSIACAVRKRGTDQRLRAVGGGCALGKS